MRSPTIRSSAVADLRPVLELFMGSVVYVGLMAMLLWTCANLVGHWHLFGSRGGQSRTGIRSRSADLRLPRSWGRRPRCESASHAATDRPYRRRFGADEQQLCNVRFVRTSRSGRRHPGRADSRALDLRDQPSAFGGSWPTLPPSNLHPSLIGFRSRQMNRLVPIRLRVQPRRIVRLGRSAYPRCGL